MEPLLAKSDTADSAGVVAMMIVIVGMFVYILIVVLV